MQKKMTVSHTARVGDVLRFLEDGDFKRLPRFHKYFVVTELRDWDLLMQRVRKLDAEGEFLTTSKSVVAARLKNGDYMTGHSVNGDYMLCTNIYRRNAITLYEDSD